MSSKTFLSFLICFLCILLMASQAAPEGPRPLLSKGHSPVCPPKAFHELSQGPSKTVGCPGRLTIPSPKGNFPRPSVEALFGAKALKAAGGRDADVVWCLGTGKPVRLRGPLGEKSAAPPGHVATNFLKANYRLFSLKSDLSDLELLQTLQSPAGHHITFQQLCDGIPAEGARVKVHILRDGRVQLVSSRLSPGLRPDVARGIPMEQAIDISRRFLGVTGDLRGPILAEKVVVPEPRPGILAWKVSIPATQPCGDWVVMLRACDGKILSVEDIRMFATGQGKAFDPNPVVTLRRTNLSDDNDSASAVPWNAYADILLEDLDNTGYLRGPYVDTALTSPRAYSPELDFRYDRSHPGFEEVMIYYHIQEFQKYLRDDLGVSPGTRQVLADAHASVDDRSWFSPLIRAIYFGDGGVDDAEDAYVILHEYMHAVAYDIRGLPNNPEGAAMSEGTSDYFAASFFANRDFMPETVGQWDGIAREPIGLRTVDSDKVYPADMVGEGHDDGEIWSSALWHLRATVGGEIADKIAAQSIYYLDGSSQFSDGLEAMLLADDALYGGWHAGAISSAFAERGIVHETLMNTGDMRAGILSEGDLTMPDGSYYDRYSFEATAGQVVRIGLASSDFDAYLLLFDPYFNILAHGDDLADGSTDARIILTIPYAATYHIFANAWSAGTGGEYLLSLSTGSLSDGTPQSTAMAFGREFRGYLGSGDFTFYDGTYYDVYTFGGHVGQQITVSMISSIMDSYLLLYDERGMFLAETDPGYDVFLRYELPYNGDYTITAAEAWAGLGNYTLLLTSSDPQLQPGTIVSGRLEDGDLKTDVHGSYFDPYQFQVSAGQNLGFKIYSTDFDPYLIVYNPYFNPILNVDDASATNLNADAEEFEMGLAGTYFIIARAYGSGETGDYRLAVCPAPITDTDSDGYPDRTETTESTNPLDPSSVPDDFDGDFIPDSMDPDNDNDGMPNLWELARGFDPLDASDGPTDADLDGRSNLAEFIAGTDPHDPDSFFRILAISQQEEGLTLQWNSSPGHHYTVRRTADLVQWTVADPDVESQGDVSTWTDAHPDAGQAVFYRVEAIPANP